MRLPIKAQIRTGMENLEKREVGSHNSALKCAHFCRK